MMKAVSELVGKVVLLAMVLWIGSAALTPAPLRAQVVCRPLALAVDLVTGIMGGQTFSAFGAPDPERNESVAQGCVERVGVVLGGGRALR